MSTRKDLEKQLTFEVQRNGNLTVLFTNAVAQHIGLSATEFECYSYLIDNGSMTAGQIAKLCGLTTGGATGLIDRLEKGGFVRRVADPADRRRVLIEAKHDEAAHKKLTSLYQPVSDGFQSVINDYSEDDLRVLVDFYRRTYDMIVDTLDTME